MLRGKSIFIDFQDNIDGTQTTAKSIKEYLVKHGVSFTKEFKNAEAIIWIQGKSDKKEFIFVIAHPTVKEKYIAAECGPLGLTETIVAGICDFFELTKPIEGDYESAFVLRKIRELNRAITGAVFSENWVEVVKFMVDLGDFIQMIGKIGGKEAIGPVIRALGDFSQAHENWGFSEAEALTETAISALVNIGKEAIPWIELGVKHSSPVAGSAFKKALILIKAKR
jgi:hypothetical protein